MFTEALNDTLNYEGYYANVTGDRGGETYRGIARNFHPTWQGWAIVDNYKAANGGVLKNNTRIVNPELDKLIEQFYYTKFWQAIKLDNVADTSLQALIFDFYVNSGGNAIKTMQTVLNEKYGYKLAVDGAMGNMTINAINAVDAVELFETYKTARIDFFKRIATGNNAKFLPGWLTRANKFNYVAVGISVVTIMGVVAVISYLIYRHQQKKKGL